MLTSNLGERHRLEMDEDYRGLLHLVNGLEHVAEIELHSRTQESVEDVSLRSLLDNLRIVIEPGWRDAGGTVIWSLASTLPNVVADPQGLLQAFLNLAQNSLRAVQESPERELRIAVVSGEDRVNVSFEDTGSGISAPEGLFQPFQEGAEGSGLGLYITRAIVRSYGGEVRYQPSERGSCFVVELQPSAGDLE